MANLNVQNRAFVFPVLVKALVCEWPCRVLTSCGFTRAFLEYICVVLDLMFFPPCSFIFGMPALRMGGKGESHAQASTMPKEGEHFLLLLLVVVVAGQQKNEGSTRERAGMLRAIPNSFASPKSLHVRCRVGFP